MIRTISKANIVAAARSSAAPTTQSQIVRFVSSLPLAAFAAPCKETKDLYGTTTLVFNEDRFARAWMYAEMGRGFDEAVALANLRIERAQINIDRAA
jgi:hypothetical protein